MLCEHRSETSSIEAELAATKALLKTISDNCPGVIYRYLMAPDGQISFPFMGSRSLELLGISAEELMANPATIFQVIPEDDRAAFISLVRETASQGENLDCEVKVVLGDGSVKWIHVTSTPEGEPRGGIRRVGILSDITARKRAELTLAENEDKFRHMFERSMDGVVAMDEIGTITDWNPQAEQIFGWTREEVIGLGFVELILNQSMEAERDEVLFRSFTHPEALNSRVQVRAIHRDGHAFPLEFAWSMTSHECETSYLAFLRDITERRTAEANLKLAKLAAEKANRSKSEFLSRMSHELRTPLNAIMGFCQLLQFEDFSDENAESIEHIFQAGKHLLGLINELLDLARIESGQVSLKLESVRPAEVAQEVKSLVSPLADNHGVRLTATSLDTSLAVKVDPQRLKQVLLNLISNGIKYTRKSGMVDVVVRSENDRALIEVTDNGDGVAPEMIERLFVPFDRLGADRTNIEGTGLGLPMAKTLVEAMNGKITVTSTLGVGTTFCASFPLAEPCP